MENLVLRYNQIYLDYINIVAPMTEQYVTLANGFPVGILNEIRAIFGHLAKYNNIDLKEKKEKEIAKAENHMTRLKRDCYKYLSMAYEDIYKEFQKLPIDTLDESIRKLIIEASKLHEKAIDNVLIARELEIGVDSEEKHEESFNYYKQAFEYFEMIQNIIKQIKEKI